ncbi:MAG: hypothetical protein IAF58_18850 [Leptolyngbya sp.]|nr:hypothetical protein [Candidatus Melainabacteria bacterium]
MNFGRSVILLTLLVSFLLPMNAAYCQNEQIQFPAVGDFPTPIRDRLGLRGLRTAGTPIDPALGDISAELMHRRPLIVWRTFAELPLPPVKTFLFLLFADLLICLAFRHSTQIASMRARSNFWKSLGVGVIVLILGTTFTKFCSETFILRPLASLLLGMLQFLCLAGLAVSSRALGSSLLSKLKVLKAETITERPVRSLVASVLVGTLIVSCLAILPGLSSSPVMDSLPVISSLPRLGARLLILFSMLGLGAIFSTRFGKKVD